MKLFTAAAIALIATQASAQQNNCGPREQVVERLTTIYGETRHTIGVDQGGTILEWWGSVEKGTWTILLTTPEGLSCIANAGDGFGVLVEALPARGTDL